MSATGSLEAAFSEDSALARPLCVDLDGTLITTDSLWEAVLLLSRTRPWVLLVAPFWLLSGRSGFKRRIGERIELDPTTLPYRAELVQALHAARARGRKVVLATAADRSIADAIAGHLGVFDTVFASDGARNLKAKRKRDLLRAEYPGGFDYVGDSSADAPVFEAAARGYLVGATSGALRAVSDMKGVSLISRRPNVLRALFRELRVHQWAKNALLLLPIVLVPSQVGLATLLDGVLAALAFCLCASAGYVFNDLIDIEADRAHATKSNRPLASGALPVAAGPPLFAGLLVLSFALSLTLLPVAFTAMLALYFAGTLTYSFYWKRLMLLDVLVLAALYTHRILAGGVASGIRVSAWLLGFSMFFFTSLAFAKRYVELKAMKDDAMVKNRGYFRADIEMVTAMGTSSGYIAALVFVLYVDSAAVRASYREPRLLWLAFPVLLYWLGRIWLLAGRGQMQEDPVKFALKDRKSLFCGAIVFLILAAARFAPDWQSNLLH
jgi:4-hydroxybenzoate polyprenyltransferase/phosphoserine phosphatase